MLFIEGLELLAEQVKKSLDDSESKNKLKKAFNLGYKKVGNSWNWKQLLESSSIVAIPNYEIGTASISKGNRIVTLSADTTVTSSFQGRFFHINGGENLYRIVNVTVATKTLVLDQAVIEDTNPSIGYIIWKRYYNIPSDCRFIHGFDSVNDTSSNLGNDGIRSNNRDYRNLTQTNPFTPSGIDQFATNYITGNITATKDSNIIIGKDGASFFGNSMSGMIIRFAGKDYRIRRIETDMRIIMYNYSEDDYDGTYTIIPDNALTVQLYNTPSIKDIILPFTYQRYVFNLINENNDRTETPNEADHAVILYGVHFYHKANNPELSTGALIEAQAEFGRVQEFYKPAKSSAKSVSPIIPRGNGR